MAALDSGKCSVKGSGQNSGSVGNHLAPVNPYGCPSRDVRTSTGLLCPVAGTHVATAGRVSRICETQGLGKDASAAGTRQSKIRPNSPRLHKLCSRRSWKNFLRRSLPTTPPMVAKSPQHRGDFVRLKQDWGRRIEPTTPPILAYIYVCIYIYMYVYLGKHTYIIHVT